MQQGFKKSVSIFNFNKHLAIKQLSHVASSNIAKYFPRFSYLVIIYTRLKNREEIAKYEKL